MKNRLLSLLLMSLLALGAVACDDTSEGLEEDTEELGDDLEEGAEDLGDEVDEAGDELEAEVEGED